MSRHARPSRDNRTVRRRLATRSRAGRCATAGPRLRRELECGEELVTARIEDIVAETGLRHDLAPKEREILLAGGLLGYLRRARGGDASKAGRARRARWRSRRRRAPCAACPLASGAVRTLTADACGVAARVAAEHGSDSRRPAGQQTARGGRARVSVTRVEHRHDATPFLPGRRSLKSLREAAAGCRGCPLYAGATQTVFGEGPKRAKLLMVGEMPGDREDRAGKVFVGPAGRELDKALEHVGIVRADVYITNVVKHFKFEERGKRRIHQTPKKSEVDACFPWLREELAVVQPEALVVLGATAGKALLGSGFRLTEARGHPIDSGLARFVMATIHPSAILRAPDDDARHAERRAFMSDLRSVADFLAG